MRRGVDSARQTRDDVDSGLGQLGAETSSGATTVLGRVARAHDGDPSTRGRPDVTPREQNGRRQRIEGQTFGVSVQSEHAHVDARREFER